MRNPHFAYDVGGLASNEQEFANVVRRLDITSTGYGMEINAEKTKLMESNNMTITDDIAVNGQKIVKVH